MRSRALLLTDCALDVTVPVASGKRREGYFDVTGEAASHDAGHTH